MKNSSIIEPGFVWLAPRFLEVAELLLLEPDLEVAPDFELDDLEEPLLFDELLFDLEPEDLEDELLFLAAVLGISSLFLGELFKWLELLRKHYANVWNTIPS